MVLREKNDTNYRIDNHNNTSSWTTKEAALKLGVDVSTILRWCKANNIQKASMPFGQKPQYILFQKDIKKAIVDIPKVASEGKRELTSKYIEDGIVVSNSIIPNPENRLELIKLQSQQIQMQSQQIITIVDEIQNTKERVNRLELKDKYIGIQRKTRNRLRKYNAYIVQEYEIEFWELWKPIRDKYEVSGYDDLSEEEGQEILRFYEEMYPKKKRTDKLDYFQ